MRLRKYFNQYGLCMIAVLPFLIPIIQSLAASPAEQTMEKYIAVCFMGVLGDRLSIGSVVWTLFVQLAPNIVLLYIFSGTFLADSETNFVYVLTRCGSVWKWFFEKTKTLFIQVCLTVFLTFLVAFLCGLLREIHFSGMNGSLYVRFFFFQIAPMFVLLFFQNYLSLWIGRSRSFLLLLIFYMFSVLFGFAFYNKPGVVNLIIKLLPASSQMYFWHTDSPILQGLSGVPVTGFTTTFSAIWLSALWVVSCVVFLVIFKKKDLLTFGKGESD